MKAKLITVLLVVGMSLQAAAMGHPHNMFAARKHIKAKHTAMSQTRCTETLYLATAYTKNAVLTTTTVWSWFNKKIAK
jgi:hypothetical protein